MLEFATQIFRDLCQLERLEWNVLAEAVDREVLSQATERAVQRTRSGPLRSEEKHAYGFPSAGKCRDDVEGREIRPMEILEHEDQQSIGGDRLDHFPELAHHPLTSRTERFTLQGCLLAGFHQRRELQQPGWRNRGQQWDDAFLVRSPDQLIDRLEHRIVCFLSAEPFDALTSHNPNLRHQRRAL